MATVTSQLTRINDLEGALTSVSIGGGAGATANTDIFIQGSQSLARRQAGVTLGGFLIDDGAGNDLSAPGIHVGMWFWHTHFAVLTDLRARFGSAGAATDYDEHQIPLSEYPSLGGWIRVWADISRTPEATGGAALDEAAVRYFGPVNSLPSVGGNAPNLVLDAIDFTTGGLLLTGTSGVFQDFLTADTNGTNRFGVVSSLSGVIFCRARLTLGSASSLAFSDSSFAIVFPQQALVAANFMGITCDLQNASTDIALASGTISSPGVVKGDFVVSGTAGALVLDGVVYSGLRIVTLTAGAVPTNCTFDSCGLITAGGATLTSCTVSNSPAAAAVSVANLNQVSVRSANSAGLTFSKEVEDQSFHDGRVFVDTINGLPGSQYPRGTITNPVDNFADAKAITSSRRFPKRYLLNGSLVLAGDNLAGTCWQGTSLINDTLALGGSDTSGASFEQMMLFGTASGLFTANNCVLSNVSDFAGFLLGGAIEGTLTLAGGEAHLVDVHAAATGDNFATLDFAGQAVLAFMPGWIGHLRITNFSNAGSLAAIDAHAGKIELAASCTAGTIVIRGVSEVVDNSGPDCTVIRTAALNAEEILRNTRFIPALL